MKTLFIAIVLVCTCSAVAAQSIEQTVDSNNVFAFKLFNQLKGDHNLIYSPFSISSALAMTYAGAHTETEKQMSNVLCFGMGQEKLHKNFEKVMKDIEADNADSLRLKVANSLWAQKSYHFLAPYFELVKTKYHSELAYLDFTEPEKARDTINGCLERKTNDRIKDIIPEGMLNGETKLVLVNALYFKGQWMNPFIKAFTRKNVFTTAKGDTVSTLFMNNGKDDFFYFEDEQYQVLELPYKGNKVSMLIFLPREKKDFKNMDKGFDYTYYKRIIPMLKKEVVDISLPKFKTTYKFSLNNMLAKMGMPLAFEQGHADFSGMTGNKDLFISNVLHEAFIEVTEAGTEAAAATAVVGRLTSAGFRNPLIFNADHPFMFVISDNTSGSILFMGQVVNPKQEE
jgi:serpin B